MSQENVDIMRQSLDAFDRRDRATWLASRDRDCEVMPASAWPEADEIHGREAAWDFYVEVAGAFEHHLLGGVEIVDAGADKLLVHYRNDLRGRASGAEVEINNWIVVTFQDGKIARDQWFADRDEALEAVGLAGVAPTRRKPLRERLLE